MLRTIWRPLRGLPSVFCQLFFYRKFQEHFPLMKCTASAFWYSIKIWIITLIMFSIFLKLIYYICLMTIKLIILVYLVVCVWLVCISLSVYVCACTLSPTVSQQSGMLSNLGTTISSPNSEPDNHALLDEKEDSYFSEIRNFISNSEMNQASSSTDKR